MHQHHLLALWFRRLSIAVAALFFMVLAIYAGDRASAACPALPTPNGLVTQTVSVPATATYTVWSRMMAPNSNDNSYYLEIDDTTCGVRVGDSAIAANTWTWVNYRDGSTNSRFTVNLTAGTHTIKMIGRETGVKLDRVVLTADTACVPTGFGDNCASPPVDATPPSVSINAPTAGQTVFGTVAVAATANDNVGVSRVDFLVDNQVVQTDTSSPYAMSWNTTALSNALHALTVRAYDAEGNAATASVSVNVSNQPPPPPTPTYRREDINQDTLVNIQDFSLLAPKFGQAGSGLGRADINSDGAVNLLDFSLLASKFGT